jgi:hypothetical protein
VEKSPETAAEGRISGPFRSLTKLLCKAGKSLISLSFHDSRRTPESSFHSHMESFPQKRV